MMWRKVAAILAFMLSGAAFAQGFDNAAVIALHRAGFGAEAIIAKVNGQPCGYDTSTTGLIALKQAGIPEAVIVAMISRCDGAAPPATSAQPVGGHAPGIFLESGGQAGPREAMLRPAAQSSVKVTGNGSILFPNIARLIVPQPTSHVVTTASRPRFGFYFNTSNRHVAEFGEVISNAAQSPGEFSLVRFQQDHGNRTVTIGKVQPYSSIGGIDPRNTLPFAIEDRGDGVFNVSFEQDLIPGEYGFVLIGERERRAGALFRIYDFTVAAPAH